MTNKRRFDGKIIITGASSGIGRASALAFAREGATTVLASRSEEKLERVYEHHPSRGEPDDTSRLWRRLE